MFRMSRIRLRVHKLMLTKLLGYSVLANAVEQSDLVGYKRGTQTPFF